MININVKHESSDSTQVIETKGARIQRWEKEWKKGLHRFYEKSRTNSAIQRNPLKLKAHEFSRYPVTQIHTPVMNLAVTS
ncbi:hypothetical protein [Sodalis phage phiSG1]|uniref:hypothetical protein n=1 Tax=Sodalis phage phiSG1 TaxID=373126 RepID=UPI00006C5BED|nr:hypothetical protein SGPHI_0004 [Sodalis phage phiSG1]BAE80467.1 hypothetical protein [Sodalis phage phiSG1]